MNQQRLRQVRFLILNLILTVKVSYPYSLLKPTFYIVVKIKRLRCFHLRRQPTSLVEALFKSACLMICFNTGNSISVKPNQRIIGRINNNTETKFLIKNKTELNSTHFFPHIYKCNSTLNQTMNKLLTNTARTIKLCVYKWRIMADWFTEMAPCQLTLTSRHFVQPEKESIHYKLWVYLHLAFIHECMLCFPGQSDTSPH